MAIQSNKTLGCVGSCLMLLGAVGSIITLIQYVIFGSSSNLGILGISGVISLLVFIGFILFLVAMHGLSKDYVERKIFSYVIYGLVISIILAVVIGFIWFALFMVSTLNGVSTSNLIAAASPTQIQSTIVPHYAPLMMAMTFVSLVSVIYNYKAFNLLADKSGVNQFKIAAKIFIAGGVVNVAVGILFGVLGFFEVIGLAAMVLISLPGGLLQYFAWGVVARGFFIIPIPQVPITQSSIYPSPTPDIYCQNCRTRNQPNSIYCSRCGQKL